MAAALLAHHAFNLGIDIDVRSAGTQSHNLPVDPAAVAVMNEHGLDIAQHVPRKMDRAIIDTDGADLVVGMTREHLRTIATTSPGVFQRAFTAKEMVRSLGVMGVDRQGTLADLLTDLGQGRSARNLMGDNPADDVADPYGQSVAVHRACASELDDLMRAIAAAIASVAA
jgi:protein-tyrosine phosphatase